MRWKEQKKKRLKGTLIIIVCAVWQAFRLYRGGAEHPAERSASVVWLLCILLWLHSECQAPLSRTGSRSSWRQEQTLAGTEAGSHCILAGPLSVEARPLLSADSIWPLGGWANRRAEGVWGALDVKRCGNDQRTLWCISSGDTLCSLECYISRLCFGRVLFPL